MKEIVIISGKGGTGKTSITASFAWLGGSDVIVADCDVDAADMHLLLQPDFENESDFYSGELASINQYDCIQCGKCAEVCRFDAIRVKKGMYFVDPLSCEGCGYCARVCPTGAITNKERKAGTWYVSHIKSNSLMVHAKLGIGSDNSGKLVAKVKSEAKDIAEEERKDFVIVDGSPGVGCPVVSSLAGANFVVLVTEPSVSGLHDLKRVYELVKKFTLKAGCIINKSDINALLTNEIEQYLKEENILHISNLPYDEAFTMAMTNGKTIVEYDQGAIHKIITESWQKIIKNLN
jgi:MinD superfamily P-loop ATPase